jgi:hypothetical protein
VIKVQEKVFARQFINHGSTKKGALLQALACVNREVKTEARVRTYSDLFWLMGGLALLAILPLVFVTGNTGAKSVAHHVLKTR